MLASPAAVAEAGQAHAGTYVKEAQQQEQQPQQRWSERWLQWRVRVDETIGLLVSTMKGRRCVLILLFALLLVVCLALIGAFAVPRHRRGDRGDEEDVLYLSPHVQPKETKEARRLSAVPIFFAPDTGAEAHAGLVTVNDTLESHLFFLHVEAKHDHMNAPLLLWLQGGPGSSSLFGQFLENGPLALDAQGKLHPREYTLRDYVNVIYLDQPVGAGFSRTASLKGYPTNLEEVARDIHRFLAQFLQLFPQYKGRDFYVAGESYGARAAVALAIRLHTNQDLPVKLKGIISGVGFLGPVSDMLDLAEYYRQFSLLDFQGWQAYSRRMEQIKQMVAENRTDQAAQLLFKTVFVATAGAPPTMFQRLTGYTYDGNALQSVEPAEFAAYRNYVASDEFKEAVHVGHSAQFSRDPLINQQLMGDYFRNITDMVATLMDNYRFLAYAGQLDPIFSAPQVESFLRSVEWSRAEQFRHGRRFPLYAGSHEEGVSGYVTTAGNFSFVVVANAGHYPGFDQTRATDEVMRRFLANNLTQHA
ncbi:hypothetical protein V5799_032002 [Amblyomma americanum]|uniref:Serine carboxypeptidase n=1 Tax=Amblyomma americanum TaxID=6943 RepID=A0AAQ4DSF4_AMBAM